MNITSSSPIKHFAFVGYNIGLNTLSQLTTHKLKS